MAHEADQREGEAQLLPAAVVQAIKLLFHEAPTSIGIGVSNQIAYLNPAGLAMFGYERAEDVVGKSFLALISPAAQDLMVELARRRGMGEDVPSVYVTTAIRADGSELPVEIRSSTLQTGGRTLRMVLHRALDARDDDDDVRERGDSLYGALFEVNPAVKLLIEPNGGRIVDANRAAVQFYGWSRDKLRAMRIMDINSLTPEEVQEEMQRAVSGKRRYFRFRHRIASGEVRHVEVHSGPVTLGGRSLLLSIIHDVTERNELERQLRVSQRLDAVGRLAGSVAHEFNNLLTVMLNASTLVLRSVPEGAAAHQHAQDVVFAAQRAAELTRELLAFGRRQVMTFRTLDLNTVVQEMSGVLQRTLGDRIGIDTQLQRDLPATRVDPSKLEHVLMNLVLNARDAMPDGGRVSIRTATRDIAAAGAGLVPEGRWVTLSVRDEGTGIDEATRSRIFDPFFTTKPAGEGTGLGLATVYGIIRQSNGHITLESSPGAGSEFTIFLPVVDDDSDQAGLTQARRSLAPGAHLLVVDDMPAVRRVLARGLEAAGFVVSQADSAREAVALLWDHPDVDAVISDIVMPERSGIELAKELSRTAPHLPVLLISGDLHGQDLSQLPTGVRAVQKPVTATRLVEELADMMRHGA